MTGDGHPCRGPEDHARPPLRLKAPVDLEAYYEDKVLRLGPMTARMGFATALLAVFLWEWDWAIDPGGAWSTLPLRLAMGLVMLAIPAAIRLGAPRRLLPYVLFGTALVIQPPFLLILKRLEEGPHFGLGGFMFWFIVPPFLTFLLRPRENLVGNILLLVAPPFYAVTLGILPGFELVKYAALVAPACAIVCVGHFVLDRLFLQLYLYRQEIRGFETTIAAAGEAVVVTDVKGVIEYVNPAFTEITGFTREEALGQDPKIVSSGHHSKEFFREFWQAIRRGETWRGEIVNRRKDGRLYTELMSVAPVTDTKGRPYRYVAIKHDLTERKALEHRLDFLAHHDPLTGLANRTLFLEMLEQSRAGAVRDRSQFALLFLDLDGFKPVNDRLGHRAGDRLLVELAGRLQGAVRESDLAARIGGDEFAVVLRKVDGAGTAEKIAAKISALVSEPYVLEEGEARVTASLGVAVFPDDAEDGESLLRLADSAMYRAKEERVGTARARRAE